MECLATHTSTVFIEICSNMKTYYSQWLTCFLLSFSCLFVDGKPLVSNLFQKVGRSIRKVSSSIKNTFTRNHSSSDKNVVIDYDSEGGTRESPSEMWTDKQFMQEIEKMANSNSEGSKAAQDTLKEILAAEAKGEKLSDAIDSIEKKVISSGMRKQTKCGFGGSLIGLGIFAGLFQWIQQLWLMKLLGRRRSGRLSTIDDSLLDGSGAESGTDIDDGSTILSRLWQRHQKLARPRRRIIELENGQKRIVNQQPVTQFVGTARPATTSQMLPEIIQPETNRLIPEQPFTTVLTGESVTPGGTIRRVFEERPSSSRTVLRQPTEPLVTDFIREVPSICTTFMQEGRRPNQPLHTTTRTFSNTTPPLDTRTTLPISSKTRYANPITSLAQTTRNLQPLDDQLETQIRRQPPSLVTLPIPEVRNPLGISDVLNEVQKPSLSDITEQTETGNLQPPLTDRL